jgi:hypothetical protein
LTPDDHRVSRAARETDPEGNNRVTALDRV